MIRVELTEESKRILAELTRRWQPREIAQHLLDELGRQSSLAAGAIQRGMAGEYIATRTGNLRRAITGRAELTSGGPALRVGVLKEAGGVLDYAGVQEYGTQGLEGDSPYPTIRPVRAKALAIPTERTRTRAGVSRTAGIGPSAFGDQLAFIPFRKGNVVGGLFLKTELEAGDRGAGAMFLLALEVDLPARRYLRRGFDRFQPELVTNLTDSLARWLAAA